MPSAAKPTAVSRTVAGDHEIAVPSLGLSLTQRRLLTLLDRPIPAASLAERSGLPPERFIRDLGRLARFRLVDGALPEDLAPGEAAPDTVTRAAVTAPPAVTIRPAANAPSIADRGGKHPGRMRWRVLAAAVAVAAAAAFTLLHFTGEPNVGQAAAPGQAPVNPAASPSRTVATAKQASAAALPPPRVETTQADRAATAAAIGALRRSEARSLGPAPDTGSRTAPEPVSDRAAARAQDAQAKARPQTAPHEPTPREAPTETPREATPFGAPHASMTTPADAAAVPTRTVPAAPAPMPPATIVAGPPQEIPTTPVPAPRVSVTPSQPAAAIATPSPATAAPAAPAVISPDVSSEALVPIARVAPDFPAEAIRRRIDSGRVRARVTVDATGHVTAIAMVSASPRGVFDDAVTAALSRWRFPPGAPGRKALVDVDFHRD